MRQLVLDGGANEGGAAFVVQAVLVDRFALAIRQRQDDPVGDALIECFLSPIRIYQY